jgi:hypothetical protein
METELFSGWIFYSVAKRKRRFESNCGEEKELLLMGLMSASEADGRWKTPSPILSTCRSIGWITVQERIETLLK